MSNINISVLAGLTLFIIAYEAYRQKNTTKLLDLHFFISFFFLAYYCFPPLSIAAFGPEWGNPWFDEQYSSLAPITGMLIAASYTLITASYNIVSGPPLQTVRFNFIFSKGLKRSLFALLTLSGIVASILATHIAGSDSLLFHYHRGDHSTTHLQGFLLNFSRSALILLALISFSLLISSNYRDRRDYWSYLAAFLVTVIFAFLFAVSDGNRGALLRIALLCLLVYYFQSGRIKFGLGFLFFSLFALAVLEFGRSVLAPALLTDDLGVVEAAYLHSQDISSLDFIKTLSSQLAHPFQSLNAAIDHAGVDASFRYFLDYPLGIIFYLQLLGFETPSTVTYINTELVRGEHKSFIPPGPLATFWYSAGLAGIIIGSVAMGGIGKVVDRTFRPLAYNPAFTPLYLYFGLTFTSWFADTRQAILGHFVLVSLMLFFAASSTYRLVTKTSSRSP